jgi:hypothetical protein
MSLPISKVWLLLLLAGTAAAAIVPVTAQADPDSTRVWTRGELRDALRGGTLGYASGFPSAYPATATSRISPTGRSGAGQGEFARAGSVDVSLAGEPAAGRSFPAERPVRSIPLALGLSAALPGLGQAYNGQWIKAGAALALEAVVLSVWASKRSSGLDAEDAFRAFAHQDWSPARYASWLNDYSTFLQTERGLSVTAPPVDIRTDVDFTDPGSWNSADRAAVRGMFDQIRAIERQVYHPETGATFSHQLPFFGEQQYYELIGKYFQFAPGWYDYPEWITVEGGYTGAIDPEMTGPGGSKPNVSATFREYARDHAHAQDLLRTASRLSTLFIVNHLIAGIDAAVSAKLNSDRVSARMALGMGSDGRPQPVAALGFRF